VSEHAALARLQTLLFTLSCGLFAGTIAELLAAKHYESTVQFVPFILCVFGLLAVGLSWTRPSRKCLQATRFLMVIIALGSLWGIYEHVTGNLAFVHEVRPHAERIEVLKAAIQGGDPILAPGVLAVGAIVAIAATYTQDVSYRKTPHVVEYLPRANQHSEARS
jgi:hypothetical protein